MSKLVRFRLSTRYSLREESALECDVRHIGTLAPGLPSAHVFEMGGEVEMSELRSALDPFRAETLPELPDARLEEDVIELQRVAELLDVERLRRIAEIDRRRVFERDGHLSMAGWLVATFRMGWGAAREHVRLARGLDAMPLTSRAVAAGDVSMSAARVLVTAREADPDAFEQAEASLVDAARIHSVADLHRVATFWRQQVERERARDGDDIEDEAWRRRALHASVTFGGSVRVDGDLDPATGETLLTALRAVQDAEARSRGRDDERTPAQRRADALGEICRQWLDRPNRPSVGGERPHLTVTVPIEALRSATAGIGDLSQDEDRPSWLDRAGAELDHTGPALTATVREMACDASVMRVVMSGRSQPLDVGRRTAVIPPAMRRAVIVRDRTCRFPGCERPHPWCDAHHVVHWADGGPTSMSNLLLLCRPHHRMVHRPAGFRIELVDGVATFRRSDGTPVEGRAPP